MTPLGRVARSRRLRLTARAMIARLPVGRNAAMALSRGLAVRLGAPTGAPASLNGNGTAGAGAPILGRADGLPMYFVSQPRPAEMSPPWPTPPRIADPFDVVQTRYESSDAALPVFDIHLFEALNEEYASRPLVPSPLEYDDESMVTRARNRVLKVHRSIDLRGKRVLEFGCGGGFEVWLLAHHFDADAWGIDIQERAAWSALRDDRVHLVLGDLAVDRPFPADRFDRLFSFYVFEHVEHPAAALAEIFRILRPGGLAWIAANLYRGPMASHRYAEVTFPWPHLLFTDDVFREFYRRREVPELTAAWVNRLTWAEYEDHFRRIGFRVRAAVFRETPIDEAFYARFEPVLGRYPLSDLRRDFFQVVLEKPTRRFTPATGRA